MATNDSKLQVTGSIDAALGDIIVKTSKLGIDENNNDTTVTTSGSKSVKSSITKEGNNTNVVNNNFLIIQMDTNTAIKWKIQITVNSQSDNETTWFETTVLKPKTGSWKKIPGPRSSTDFTIIKPVTVAINESSSQIEISQPSTSNDDGIIHYSVYINFICMDDIDVTPPTFTT